MSQTNTKKHSLQHRLQQNSEIIQSLKERQDEKRTRAEKIADKMTDIFGSIGFLVANIIWFAIWIVINLGLIPGVAAFDPFPFGLLTMIVSLEAIILAIFVLISQNRSSKIADLREEVDLQVDMLTEREITKLMQVVCAVAEKIGVDLEDDEELQQMLTPAPLNNIEQALERQVLGQEWSQNHHSQKTKSE
jgi:uncharacterized membrane protein